MRTQDRDVWFLQQVRRPSPVVLRCVTPAWGRGSAASHDTVRGLVKARGVARYTGSRLGGAQMEQKSNLRLCPILPMVQVSQLKALWAECGSSPPAASIPTVEFYGHRPASGALRCFSNFYEHSPFDFVVPPSCGAEALVAAGRPHRVPVTFTEKAIMLCKASIMGDYKTYDQILEAASPQEAKALGRTVSPFVPAIWDALVCEVARAVCVQKALGVPELHARLLETGDDSKRLQLGHWPRHRPQGRLHALPLAGHQHPRLGADAGTRRDGSGGRKQRRHKRWWQRRQQRRPAGWGEQRSAGRRKGMRRQITQGGHLQRRRVLARRLEQTPGAAVLSHLPCFEWRQARPRL